MSLGCCVHENMVTQLHYRPRNWTIRGQDWNYLMTWGEKLRDLRDSEKNCCSFSKRNRLRWVRRQVLARPAGIQSQSCRRFEVPCWHQDLSKAWTEGKDCGELLKWEDEVEIRQMKEPNIQVLFQQRLETFRDFIQRKNCDADSSVILVLVGARRLNHLFSWDFGLWRQ